MNNFRALNSMSKGNLNYNGFDSDTLFGYTINLAVIDSTFILPIIIFCSNYMFIKVKFSLMKYSNHPWLINYNHFNHRKLIYFTIGNSLFNIF